MTTNFKNQALGLAQKIIEETLPKIGLTNKHRRLYIYIYCDILEPCT